MTGALAWVVLIPLFGASFGLLVSGALARWANRVAVVSTVVAAAAVAWSVSEHGALHHAVGGWGAPLGIELRADGVAAVMLLAVAVVGALTSFGAPEPPGDGRFFPLWFFSWAALNALFLSADVFNLYVTLELATLGAVGLLASRRTLAATEAALRYLLFALPGSLVYLLGVAVLYGAWATLDLRELGARVVADVPTAVALALMTLGLCLKAALFPLHGWLPQAYVTARPQVSALLAGLLGKASFYVLLRVWMGAMPAALAPRAGLVLGVMAAAGIAWGSLLALAQRRLKPLIAYSSVAQAGYLFLVFPLATSSAWSGGVYLAVSHAAAKASMFLAAGTIERAVGNDELADLRGLARDLPVTVFSLALAGASLMGMPPSGGFVAKWLLVRAALEAGQWWLAVTMLLGGLLTAGYVFKILRGTLMPAATGARRSALPRGAELIPLMLALVAFALGILSVAPLRLLEVGMTR